MDGKSGKRPREREAEPAGLAPVRAFMVVCALAAAAGGLVFATRDASPSEPAQTAVRSPDYTLTDAEAIAEFERLNAQLMKAYEERNIALAEDVFTSDSPMLPRVRKEIQTLVESSVVTRSRFEEISTITLTSGPRAIEVERVEVLYPKFETEAGKPAAGVELPERQRVQWDLRVEDGRWLLHDALVVDRKILERARS